MASNRNDDMDRNRNTPQANTKNPSSQGNLDRNTGVSGGTHGNTTQGSTGSRELGRDMDRDRSEQGRTPGMDPVNRDREMNRDTEVGQRGTGSGQSGRETFGSDRSKDVGTPDTSRKTERGDSDIPE